MLIAVKIMLLLLASGACAGVLIAAGRTPGGESVILELILATALLAMAIFIGAQI